MAETQGVNKTEGKEMWVYVKSQSEWLWTVGFYDPNGNWHPDSDHANQEDAAKRCAWLNGREV